MTTPTTTPASHRAPAAAADGLTVAIDIGGTKIAGALVHPDGTMSAMTRRPTPRGADRDADAVMAAVTEVVAELSRSPLWPSAVRCGIGSAGPVDTSRGTVSPVNIGAWREFPVQARVEAELAARGARGADGAAVPTVLAGDGVAMTAAEHWLGAAQGHANALCMVVSTGVGGGLILNNRLHPGPTGNAGHIGHISVAFDGEPCACGGHGCVESIASGTAIARWALAQGWTPRSPAVTRRRRAWPRPPGRATRSPWPPSTARAARLRRPSPPPRPSSRRTSRSSGAASPPPHDTLFAPIRRHLAAYATLSFARGVRVVPASLGTHAGLIGAAAAATMLLPCA